MVRRLVVVGGLLALALACCTRQSTPPGPDVAAGKHGEVGYVYLRWEEGLSLMIWHDIAESSTGRGVGTAGESAYRYGGQAESPDGRQFEWWVETEDGRTAEFWIDDTRVDLANGKLFIITTRAAGTQVEQLQRDLEGVETNHESCIAFAESDPDLRAFTVETSATD